MAALQGVGVAWTGAVGVVWSRGVVEGWWCGEGQQPVQCLPRRVGLMVMMLAGRSRWRLIGRRAEASSRGAAAGGALVKGGSSSFLLWHQTKAVQDSPMLLANVMCSRR